MPAFFLRNSVQDTAANVLGVNLVIIKAGPGGLQGRVFEKAGQPQLTPLHSWDLRQKPG